MHNVFHWFRAQWRGGQGLLLLVVVAAAVLHVLIGNFSPRIVPDTPSYLNLGSWEEVFGGNRTPFYGWLALAIEPVVSGYRLLPWLNYFALAAAMLLLYRAALRYGLSESAALALTATLPFGNAALLFLGYVHPEVLAISLLLMALACLLFIARERVYWGWYLAGGLALSLSYLMKPGFLLFVGLFPVLLVLLGLHARASSWRVLLQRAVVVGVIGVVPFMVYSGVRYVAVGHFHVVSFGGYAGTGLSGQIMNAETIPRLPEEFREPARVMLEERERQENAGVVLPIPISSTHQEPVYWSAVLGYFDIFARNYDRIKVIVFRALRDEEQSWVEADARAQAFNRAVKSSEPGNYALYVVGATTRFMGLLVAANATFVPALVLLMLVIGVRSLQGWRGLDTEAVGRSIVHNGVPLLLITVTYVLASYVPAVAITFPARRYVDTAGILMAALPLYLAWLLWRSRDR